MGKEYRVDGRQLEGREGFTERDAVNLAPIPAEMMRRCKNRVQPPSFKWKIFYPSPKTLRNFRLGT